MPATPARISGTVPSARPAAQTGPGSCNVLTDNPHEVSMRPCRTVRRQQGPTLNSPRIALEPDESRTAFSGNRLTVSILSTAGARKAGDTSDNADGFIRGSYRKWDGRGRGDSVELSSDAEPCSIPRSSRAGQINVCRLIYFHRQA